MLRIHFLPRLLYRVGDGSPWVESIDPNHESYMAAMDALRLGHPRYYFRRVRRIWYGLWQETGESWSFDDPRLFGPEPPGG